MFKQICLSIMIISVYTAKCAIYESHMLNVCETYVTSNTFNGIYIVTHVKSTLTNICETYVKRVLKIRDTNIR